MKVRKKRKQSMKLQLKAILYKQRRGNEFYFLHIAFIFSVNLFVFATLFPTEEIMLALVSAYISTVIMFTKLVNVVNDRLEDTSKEIESEEDQSDI